MGFDMSYARSRCGGSIPVEVNQAEEDKRNAALKEELYRVYEDEDLEKERIKEECEYVKSKLPAEALNRRR